jgi:hypothetical protein
LRKKRAGAGLGRRQWDGSQSWAVPAVSAEFPVDAATRTGVDLRGYRQLAASRLRRAPGGLAGTVLKLRNSLDASATWADSGAELALNQYLWVPQLPRALPLRLR